MEKLINRLKITIPDINFEEGTSFSWSPAKKIINYTLVSDDSKLAEWSLLHEVGHAVLEHRDYSSDVELIMLEAAAWERAKSISRSVGVNIDEDHIQDCIDTYRDWLHQRSTCPRCGIVCLQTNSHQYDCHNCSCSWRVSAARFCRPYRLTNHNSKRPLEESTTLLATFS